MSLSYEKPDLKTPGFVPTSNNLYPTIPDRTTRYDIRTKVDRFPATIESCKPLGTGPRYLPPKWISTVHPEGATYFFSTDSTGLRFVTDSWIYELDTEFQVSVWGKYLADRLSQQKLIAHQLEVYLRVDGEVCEYYLVDFEERSIFWLDNTSTDQLLLPGVVSNSHIGILLETQFWAHVDHFPMHFGGFEPTMIDQLLAVFIHGLGDQLTSRTSTFPYDERACEKFIALLKTSRDHSRTGPVVATVARLWKVIIEHRFQTHHGEEQARLDRDSEILACEPRDSLKSPAWNTLLQFLTLGAVDSYRRRLELTMKDDLVYEQDWKSLLTETAQEYRDTLSVSSVVAIASTVLGTTATQGSLFSSGAMVLSVSSLIASLSMIRFVERSQTTSATGASYLSSNRSRFVNFDLLALFHSLPSSLLHWSLFFIAAHIICFTCGLGARFPIYFILIPLYITGFLLALAVISRTHIFLRSLRGISKDNQSPV